MSFVEENKFNSIRTRAKKTLWGREARWSCAQKYHEGCNPPKIEDASSPMEGCERRWVLWRSCYSIPHRFTCAFHGEPVSLSGAAFPAFWTRPPCGLDPWVHKIDQAILSPLNIQAFRSVQDRAALTCLFSHTVHSYFTRSLGLKIRYLQWISHVLFHEWKLDYIRDSQAALGMFQSGSWRTWHDIVTFDQSCFYFNTEHERGDLFLENSLGHW